MVDIPLKCECGLVQGTAHNITPTNGMRVVCYCDDCQAFAKFLDKEDDILDEFGGTDIFQMTPSQLKFTRGSDQLRCVRLKKKGLYRWYTGCCNTPIGNTVGAGFAFVGVIHNIMDDEGVREKNLGPVRTYVQGNFAKEGLPPEKYNEGFPFLTTMRVVWKLIVWRLQGKHKPSPFFNEDGKAVSTPIVNDQD